MGCFSGAAGVTEWMEKTGQILAPVATVAATAIAAWRMNHSFLPGLQARLYKETPQGSLEGSSCFAGALQVSDYELPPVQVSPEE